MKTALVLRIAVSFALSLLLIAAPSATSADILYITGSSPNTNDNTIEKIDESGVRTVFAHSGLHEPWALAFDSAGNLYVSNHGNNTIEKFNSSGTD